MQIAEAIHLLQQMAPPAYQESYDNAGLIVGQANTALKGVLVSLDCTEAVLEEALEKGCNLIVAHHPIVFKGLKRLTGATYVERVLLKAIKNDLAIYAIHTNLDNMWNGVNAEIAQRIGLQESRILAPKSQLLRKLVVFVPTEACSQVAEALYAAGAGNISNYSKCSFRSAGTGSFQPNAAANPFIGQAEQYEEVGEMRLEVIFEAFRQRSILKALFESHPYEEVAHDIISLENEHPCVGSGMIGLLPEAMPTLDFLKMLKEKMPIACIRHTAIHSEKVQKIALCGGAGFFLLGQAIAQKADVFITADVKYHEFFDADNQIVLADIGHYESEFFTKHLIAKFLSEKITNIAVNLSSTNTNPIHYL